MTRRSELAAVVAALLLGACTGGGEDTTASSMAADSVDEMEIVVPEGDEAEVLGPLGETELEVETDDGLVQIGVAEVPDNVAPSFPIPDDLVVQIASASGSNAGFSGVSELSFDELREFYEEQLTAAGYEWTQEQLVDGVVVVYSFDGSDGAGDVAISSAPSGGRSVLVTFTE